MLSLFRTSTLVIAYVSLGCGSATSERGRTLDQVAIEVSPPAGSYDEPVTIALSKAEPEPGSIELWEDACGRWLLCGNSCRLTIRASQIVKYRLREGAATWSGERSAAFTIAKPAAPVPPACDKSPIGGQP